MVVIIHKVGAFGLLQLMLLRFDCVLSVAGFLI